MVTVLPGQAGRFQSVCFPSNTAECPPPPPRPKQTHPWRQTPLGLCELPETLGLGGGQSDTRSLKVTSKEGFRCGPIGAKNAEGRKGCTEYATGENSI